MEFRILGPLEVVQDGEPLALGRAQQRAVLAVLVLHRGEVVSVDRLIDELWGERPPATAAKAVQGYVSHLRKALGSEVIVTQGRGYRLAVAAEEVDWGRFESLAADGRRALADGDPERARERLGAALGLWRGEPLADFTYELFAQSTIERLAQARLAAVEDRIEADLALGGDGELIGELESLIASNPLRERLRGQLMRALYRAGRQAEALAVYRQTSELLREELGLEPSRMLQELERSILEQDASLGGGSVSGGGLGVCPFKGLAVFDRADAEYFFGRERLVSDLLARLVESTLVGILGPSGIGKSSLLRAGVLPALSAGVLPGSASWRQVLIRPGERPCAELRRALAGDGLDRALGQLSPGERIVIAVDQLEELFTVCELERERAAFLEELVGAARDPQRRALIVVALRADLYGRLASYPSFGGPLSGGHVLVGPMDRHELARAIEQPAARAGLELEPGLAAALVSEVVGEPGGLPVLSTTLLELWRGRDGRVLRYEGYRASGGVRGAVARLAEAAYTRLDESERRIARAVMLRLAGGEDATLARRRVPLPELQRIDGAGPVLAALTDARLVTISDGEIELSHEALLREWPRYRGWLEEDRVGRRVHAHLTVAAGEWDAQGRDPGEVYRGARLASALDWTAQHHGELTPLEREFIAASRRRAEREARRLRAILAGVVALLLVSLVAGALALIQKRQATNAARVALARELAAQAVSEPRIDLAMLLGREAINLDRSPPTEGALLATLLRSPRVIGTFAQAAGSAAGASGAAVGSAPGLALSPDGHTLSASHFGSGEVRFYDSRTHAPQRRPLSDFSGDQPPVYSTDGSLLVYLAQGGVVVRRADTLALLYTLAFDPVWLTHPEEVTAPGGIEVAPDRRSVYLAYSLLDTAGNPTTAYLTHWSLPSAQPLSTTRIGSGAIFGVRLIDAGTRLVVVAARRVSVLDTHSMHIVRSTAIPPTPASSAAAAISPDGGTAAIGSRSGSVSFLDLSTGHVQPGLGGHAAAVAQALYSRDGRTLLTVGDDGKVIVWNPKTATPAKTLTGYAGHVQSAALAPDATTLYTSSLDAGVLAWDLAGDRGFGRRDHLGATVACCGLLSPPVPPTAVSPDGSRFAVRLGPSTVGLFSADTRQRLATIRARHIVLTALAWSPSGTELALAGYSGVVQLWTVDGAPRPVRSLVGLHSLLGLPEAIESVAFSPDGTLIAASDYILTQAVGAERAIPLAKLAIWRADTGSLVAPTFQLGQGNIASLAFSPTSKLLAVALPDKGALILNPSTGQARRTLQSVALITALAFAPDGTLAIGTGAGTVELRNPNTGAQIAPPIAVASNPVASVAFDPSGQRFATTGYTESTVKLWFRSTLQQEGTAFTTDPGATATVAFSRGPSLLAVDDQGDAFTWPISLTAWKQQACAVAGRNLTQQEWTRYITGHPYTTLCPRPY